MADSPSDPLVLTLPMPPSANNLFVNRKGRLRGGRAKGIDYKLWLDSAGWEIKLQAGAFEPPYFPGVVAIDIACGLNRRSDLDNRLKALLDLLVRQGIVRDDNLIDDLRIRRDGVARALRVEVRALGGGK